MKNLKKLVAWVVVVSVIIAAPATVMAAVTEVCNIEFDSDYQIGTDAITDSGSGTGGIWQGTADDVAYTEELVSGIGGKASDDYSWKVSLAGTATQNFHYRVGINGGTYLNANGYARFTADIYTNRFESFVIMMGSQNALQISTSSDGAVVVRIAGTEVENPVIPALNTWNTYEIVVYDADGNKGTAEAQVVSAYVNGELIGTVTSTNTASFRYFGIKPHANGKKVDIAPDNPLVVMMDNLKVERNNSDFASDYAFTIAGEASAATVSDVQRTISYTGASAEELISALNADFDYEVVDENGALTDNLNQVKFLRVYDGERCVAIYNVTADVTVPEPANYSIVNDFNDVGDISEDNIPSYFSANDMNTAYFTPTLAFGVYGKSSGDGAYELAFNGIDPGTYPYLRLQYNHNSFNDSPFAFNAGNYAYLSFETAREGNDSGVRIRMGGAPDSASGHPIEYLTTGFQVANEDLGKMSPQKTWDKVEILFYDYEVSESDATQARAKYDVYINGQAVKTAVQMEYSAATNFGHIRFYMYHNQDKPSKGKIYLDNVIFRVCDEKPVVSETFNITEEMASLGLLADEVSRKISSDEKTVLETTVADVKSVIKDYSVTVTDANGNLMADSLTLSGARIYLTSDGTGTPACYVCEAYTDLEISSDILTVRKLVWTISGFNNMTAGEALASINKGKTAALTVYRSDMTTPVTEESKVESGMMLKVQDATGDSVWYTFADAIWRLDDPYYYFTRNSSTGAIESVTAVCEADMYVSDVQKNVTLVIAQYNQKSEILEDVKFTEVTLNEKKVMTWGGGATGGASNSEVALGGNYQIKTTLDITYPVGEDTCFKVIVLDDFDSLTPLKKNYTVYPQSSALSGKTLVSFGDSVVGNAVYGYPHQVANNTGINYINAGIGGSCMMYVEKDLEKPLSMVEIVDRLNGTSSDWSAADGCILGKLGIESFEDATENNKLQANYVHYYENIRNLDLSQVDIVTLAFGTNDWGSGTNAMDNETKTADKTSFAGSVRYVIEGLKKANPDLKIVFLTPVHRMRELENAENSATAGEIVNSGGKYTLKDFADKLTEVVDETQYNGVYVADMYEYGGINRYNAYTYLYDGAHPVYSRGLDPDTRGIRLLGSKVTQILTDIFVR